MRQTLLSIVAATLLSSSLAQAQECQPRRLLVVLDRSSSMTYEIGGVPKWDIAVEALTTVVEEFEESIDFGLMMFPSEGQCSPGDVDVEIGAYKADAIVGALAEPPPAAGNWTPMAQSLDVVGGYEPLMGTDEPHVLLITDGWQWCSPHDPGTRFTPVESVRVLAAAGATVWVVGFGDGVDVLALNRMATAAGTALDGCDPESEDLEGPHCYYQADAGDELLDALEEIAVHVSEETCNGIDDDCDGDVDEDVVAACETECGVGERVCEDGEWLACSAPEPPCPGEEGDADSDADGDSDVDADTDTDTDTDTGSPDSDFDGDGWISAEDDYREPGCACTSPGGSPERFPLGLLVLGALAVTRRRWGDAGR